MTFAWPHLLFLLILPILLLLWELLRRVTTRAVDHPKIQRAEAGAQSLQLRSTGATQRQRARVWLWLGLLLAITALARPQWGQIEEPVFDQSREILIAVDLSRSMLAQDIKPTRLDRAKLLISSLLEKLEGERVGLIVFSGTAFLQCPLSADYEILREFLPALDADYLPEGGTNYRALLDTAQEAFSSSGSADRFLIVLSDGETTNETWQEAIPPLQKRNIRTIGLGIGTAAGSMIPDGHGAFVKDERGAVVLSRLESRTLQELAQATQGVYRDASTWVDLAALVRATVDAGRKGDFVEKKTVRHVERFQWALGPALVCLLLSFWLEFPVRPRPRALKLTAAKLTCLIFATLWWAPRQLPAAESPATPELSPLGKIVGRLSTLPEPSGQDWAELGRETITWGQKLQSEKHPVAEGPIRDALAAVSLGEKRNPTSTDWQKMRAELEALLQKPEPPPEPQPEQKQSNEDKKSDQQNQPQPPQNGSPNSDQQKQPSPENQNSSSEKSPQNQAGKSPPDSSSDQQTQPPQSGNPSGQSAFGDMNAKAPPPDPTRAPMQQVGGNQEKAPAPAGTDPALAMPLQKLQNVRDKDSPAELFQLMAGKPEKSAANQGKNW